MKGALAKNQAGYFDNATLEITGTFTHPKGIHEANVETHEISGDLFGEWGGGAKEVASPVQTQGALDFVVE